MKKDLMPQGYFDEVQKHMVREGFTLISRVAIDNTECEYHVPCTKARDTALFFHLRNKSAIVVLRYHENDAFELGTVEGYWKVSFYFRFHNYSILLENNPHWLGSSLENTLFGDMPILGTGRFEVEGFQNRSGLCLHRDTGNEQVGLRFEGEQGVAVNERILASRIRVAVRLVEKYLDSKPFYRICLLDFFPHYTFSGSSNYEPLREQGMAKLESIFWPKFDWSYFRHLVVRPYGYNFHGKAKQVA
jgi:hypothetical protein